MSDWLRLAFVFLAAVNPAAVALASWAPPRPRGRALETAGVGVAVAMAGVGAMALLADRLLAALDVAPETFRIAAGIVMLAAGAYAVARPGRWTALADGLARILGTGLVIVAAGLIVEGVRDI